jgi:hypothetical protein
MPPPPIMMPANASRVVCAHIIFTRNGRKPMLQVTVLLVPYDFLALLFSEMNLFSNSGPMSSQIKMSIVATTTGLGPGPTYCLPHNLALFLASCFGQGFFPGGVATFGTRSYTTSKLTTAGLDSTSYVGNASSGLVS